MVVVEFLLGAGAVALGVWTARKSIRWAVGTGLVALASILFKLVIAHVPVGEPRLLPYDAYAAVANWYYEIPTLYLIGAGVAAAWASRWKRDLLLVLGGLFVVRVGWVLWESRDPGDRLTGRVQSDGVCLQSTPFSCSAAASASLLWHHGVATDEREMARLCDTREGVFGGTSDIGVFVALRKKVGDRVRAGAPELDALPTPCIVSVRLTPTLYHSIVVREVRGAEVVVMDPIHGILRLPRGDFLRRWTGGAIWIEAK